MNIKQVQLISTSANVGRGANDGVYPPGGLLTIASALAKQLPGIDVVIDDQHHSLITIRPNAEIIGIQVASTLCYKNALEVAYLAKARGKIVVLGGPHVTTLYTQIMNHRPEVDYCIRGKGEVAFTTLIKALQSNETINNVPGLSWREANGNVHHNSEDAALWRFDSYTPLPLNKLSSGIQKYWRAFRNSIDPKTDATFLLFTHFGCGYRDRRVRGSNALLSPQGNPLFCSFCSLHDPLSVREPKNILSELQFYLTSCNVPAHSRVHLKCYGDNIGPQIGLVRSLAQAIKKCSWWNDYDFKWTFYCQSSYLSEELASLLKQIGTANLYIGFDGVNDEIQRSNALGTDRRTHDKAIELCLRHGINIQAGSVVGLAGEMPETLEELYQFFVALNKTKTLERINSAVLFIIPGTAAYELLCQREPQLRGLDLLPTDEIRRLWIKHFCPQVTHELLKEYALRIDALSPGPHARMGYEE